MFDYSYLKYPPIKPRKLPQYLILRNYGKEEDDGIRFFSAFSTKTGKICGHVSCIPEILLRDKQKIRSMYVDELISYNPGHGVGTILLDFVRTLSKKYDCGGRFHLNSSACFQPNRIPHIFYRKYGMTSGSKCIDRKLDKFIKQGKMATHRDFGSLSMYYPPKDFNGKIKFLECVMKFLSF